MFDTLSNRENAVMTISGQERMSEQYKQARRLSRMQKAKRLLRDEGAAGVVRWAARKLNGAWTRGNAPLTGNNVPDNDLRLDSLDTEARQELYFSNERIAVYTVLFGAYDRVRSPLFKPDNVEYYIITDQETTAGGWIPRAANDLLPKEITGDPVLCNRWCKMHPHLLFPEYSLSVYADANLLITGDLTPMTSALDAFPVSMFRHSRRDCVYDEIRACIHTNKISRRAGRQQERLLRRHRIPKHWGLLEAPVIARRHHDPRCITIMEAWWQSFLAAPAKRDQIALIDCLWQRNIPPEKIGVLGSDVLSCPMLIKFQHREQKEC